MKRVSRWVLTGNDVILTERYRYLDGKYETREASAISVCAEEAFIDRTHFYLEKLNCYAVLNNYTNVKYQCQLP